MSSQTGMQVASPATKVIAMAERDYCRRPGDLFARDEARLCDRESRLTAAFRRRRVVEAVR